MVVGVGDMAAADYEPPLDLSTPEGQRQWEKNWASVLSGAPAEEKKMTYEERWSFPGKICTIPGVPDPDPDEPDIEFVTNPLPKHYRPKVAGAEVPEAARYRPAWSQMYATQLDYEVKETYQSVFARHEERKRLEQEGAAAAAAALKRREEEAAAAEAQRLKENSP